MNKTNLIEKYNILKSHYRSYDTKHALRRTQAFRIVINELRENGYSTAVEILGSINFGIVEPFSDIDCILLHQCNYHFDSECDESCPSFLFETDELKSKLRKRLQNDNLKIDFLDCINLNFVDKLIKQSELINQEILYRLMFYRTIGRPVNRKIIASYCTQLEDNKEFMESFTKWGIEALKDYLKTSTHKFSFNKYNERIVNKGHNLPRGLKEDLEIYLDFASE